MKKTDLPLTLPTTLQPYSLLKRLFGEHVAARITWPTKETKQPFGIDLSSIPDLVYDHEGRPIPYTQQGWEGLRVVAYAFGKRGGLVYLNEVEVIPYHQTKQEKLEEVWNIIVDLGLSKEEVLDYLN